MLKQYEVVKKLEEKTGLQAEDIQKVLNALPELIKEVLTADGELKLGDLGTFIVRETKERMGINPRTKEKITIPAKKRVKFWPARDLRTV
jgi:DNA-binding protein HU-beta